MHGENKTLFIYYVIVSKRAEILSNHRVQSSCWKEAYVLLEACAAAPSSWNIIFMVDEVKVPVFSQQTN